MSVAASRSHAAAPAAEIPGPEGSPILGVAPALRKDLLGTLQDGFARYGDVVAFRAGPRHGPHRLVVALFHPDDARRVFVDTDAFTRDTRSYRALRELFGLNISTASGDDWQRQKRLLQPLFTRAAMQQYTELIETEARAVVERIIDDPGEAIDTLRTTEGFSLRVLGGTLFKDERGIDPETIAALEHLLPIVARQLTERSQQSLRLPLSWPTPRNRRFAETRDALQGTIERVLARHRERAEDAADLVTELRDARDPDGGRPLSEQEVRDQALIFLIAGYSTTSNALCSTLYLLGRHAGVQERVAAGGEELARASVQEALRLYPPSYVLGRRVGPAGAEIAGYALEPGTDVLVSPWITHRRPDFWRDPERFAPSRFLDDPAPHAWFPFAVGARACIGRQLALLESTVLVRALLERCRLESLDAEYPMSQLTSMRPSRLVRIACRPR